MKTVLAASIGFALLGIASSAGAITDEEGNAAIQFNFQNPGARSLALGGAFLGLADDSTAAYSNPAGLTQLAQFEVSVEGRHISYDTEFVTGGEVEVSPFGLQSLDVTSTDSSVDNLAYLAVVWPHDRWAIAAYRQVSLDYQTSFDADGTLIAGTSDFAVLPYSAEVDLDTVNYGLSGAFRIGDAFSVGISLIYSDFEVSSGTVRFQGGAPIFSTSQDGEDDDFAWNIGALWEITEHWQIGAVYRSDPEYSYSADLFDDTGSAEGFPKDVGFQTPDVFGVGVAFRPNENWTFTLDADRVSYSNLTDNIQSGFRADGDPRVPAEVGQLKIDDATEVHVGAEYTFLEMTHPLSIRVGYWSDPEHVVRFRGDPDTDVGNAVSNAVIFSTGDDESHFSGGIGWAFQSFQIDLAFDISSRVDTYSLSGVYRFD